LHKLAKKKEVAQDSFIYPRKRKEINGSIIPLNNEFALVEIENNGYRVYNL